MQCISKSLNQAEGRISRMESKVEEILHSILLRKENNDNCYNVQELLNTIKKTKPKTPWTEEGAEINTKTINGRESSVLGLWEFRKLAAFFQKKKTIGSMLPDAHRKEMQWALWLPITGYQLHQLHPSDAQKMQVSLKLYCLRILRAFCLVLPNL